MKRIYKTCLVLFVAMAVSPQWLNAEEDENDFSVKAGLNLGFRTLDFEQEFSQGALSFGPFSVVPPLNREVSYRENFTSADFSLAAAWSKFYITANYETNINEEDAILITETTFFDPAGTEFGRNKTGFEFDRYDYSITLGWNAFDNFSLFTGYKSGTTDTSRVTATLDSSSVTTIGSVKTSFEESGPYIGASYSWLVGHGVLTLSTAYAIMDGKYDEKGDELIVEQRSVVPAEDFAVTQQALEYDGDTEGFSVNLSWNVLASEHVGYFFGIKWQEYDFEADTNIVWEIHDRLATTITPLTGKGEVENSETITAFYAGVNYIF